MKVSIITPDLSHNCLGRAHLLAQLLERQYEVEIVGPELGDGVWSPVKNDYEYQGVKTGHRLYKFLPSVPELLDLIDGDIILASKPRTTSYGISFLKQISGDHPLVLDIDDWESGFQYRYNLLKTYIHHIPRLINSNSFYYIRAFEYLSRLADGKTVSNRFLHNKFGGTIIRHARDTDVFDPDRFDKQRVRNEYNLPADKKIIMFSGTPRDHKGVDNLVQAVSNINLDDTRLVIVGADESELVDRLRQMGDDSLIIRGQQPFEDIPKWIAAADIIAIPQKDSPATRGQLPAKVFDAMAMAKPIVATRVSDLPEILDECGVIIPPESVPDLQTAITELLEDDNRRETLGQRARQKCVEEYSHDAVAPKLASVIESVS